MPTRAGPPEYNLALGGRRAAAVKDYLVSLGVAGRPHHDDQQREGAAGVHRRNGSVLAAEPARVPHHHR